MSSSQLPSPSPDEKLVLIIEIRSPEGPLDSSAYREFDGKFSAFKRQLDALINDNFRGSLKMKVLMKKAQQSSIVFGGGTDR